MAYKSYVRPALEYVYSVLSMCMCMCLHPATYQPHWGHDLSQEVTEAKTVDTFVSRASILQ